MRAEVSVPLLLRARGMKDMLTKINPAGVLLFIY
jgi:hypothetical protein